ncbi:MAG: hypothetical protein AABX16_04115 [Nanoarchaeota archaeon]
MISTQKRLMLGAIGLVSLVAGCDSYSNKEILKGKIENAEIMFIHRIQPAYDGYTIEIYDTKGNIKAQFDFGSTLPNGFIQYDDGSKADFKNSNIIKTNKQNSETE